MTVQRDYASSACGSRAHASSARPAPQVTGWVEEKQRYNVRPFNKTKKSWDKAKVSLMLAHRLEAALCFLKVRLMLQHVLEDAVDLCFLKAWSAQCLNWPIVTRAHTHDEGPQAGQPREVPGGEEGGEAPSGPSRAFKRP